tara:strand:+ start:2409 stop:2642 length:234 start_codon:yes stop_codon:yes gene_type:complete
MKEDYLKFVEEHRHQDKKNLFEKVVTLTKRAKSLYSLEESARSSMKHKPPFQAILENNEERLLIKKSFKDTISDQKE